MNRQTLSGIMSTKQYGDAMEARKRPGQDFCDCHGWRLHDKYNVLQRPDKVTRFGGAIYRTITPVYHIWYQEKNDPSHHIWVEFNNSSIIVKDYIQVSREDNGPSQNVFLIPNSNNYQSVCYFSNGKSASDYILRL